MAGPPSPSPAPVTPKSGQSTPRFRKCSHQHDATVCSHHHTKTNNPVAATRQAGQPPNPNPISHCNACANACACASAIAMVVVMRCTVSCAPARGQRCAHGRARPQQTGSAPHCPRRVRGCPALVPRHSRTLSGHACSGHVERAWAPRRPATCPSMSTPTARSGGKEGGGCQSSRSTWKTASTAPLGREERMPMWA